MKLKSLLIGTILMGMSIPTFAAEAPVNQIAPTETKFTLNGNPVLEGIPTFTKSGDLYIPFMDVVDLFNIGWEKDNVGNVNFTSEPLPATPLAMNLIRSVVNNDAHAPTTLLPDFLEGGPIAELPGSSNATEGPLPIIYVPDPEHPSSTEENVVTEEGILMEHVSIVDVKDNDGKISVVIGNLQNPENPMEQTIFHLTEQTNIKHVMNKKLYTPADLKAGQTVTIEHSKAMTRSIPAQATAYEITLIHEGEEANNSAVNTATVMENVKILDVATKNGKVTSIAVGDINQIEPHTIFSFKEDTGIQHIRDRRIYTLENLKAGQIINVSYSSPVLESYPVQIVADQIILVDALVQ